MSALAQPALEQATGTPERMQAAVTRDWNSIAIEEVPVPELRPDEALVRVRACGICATDLKIISGVYADTWPPSLPFIQGHEWAGDVVAVGSDVYHLQVGDRVAAENHDACGRCLRCREGRYNLCLEAVRKGPHYRLFGHTHQGAFAQYAARPEVMLHKLPESVSYPQGTIVNQGAMAVNAVRRARLQPSESVAVLGPGLVGLILVQLARAAGATRVLVSGRGERLETALRLGADAVVDYTEGQVAERIKELSGGGVDVVFETAGTRQAVQDALQAARRGGRVVLVGLTGHKPLEWDTDRIVLDELDVLGVRGSPNCYPALIELMAAGVIDVDPLLSTTYPLEEIAAGFDHFRQRRGGAIRVIIDI